jgi:hypothetical protein
MHRLPKIESLSLVYVRLAQFPDFRKGIFSLDRLLTHMLSRWTQDTKHDKEVEAGQVFAVLDWHANDIGWRWHG